jgi:imidazoleglycerol phosphate dehydratase HisB
VLVRTLSKAWGLANLRVGYALGAPATISRILAAGGPYAIAGPSVALALAWLEDGVATTEAFIACVREQRSELSSRFAADGAEFYDSGANFICLRNGERYAERLAAAGIRVRSWAGDSDRSGFVRISVPGETMAYQALCAALFDGATWETVGDMIATNERREAKLQRRTKETEISASLCLDGTGVSNVSTGIGFLDHMLDALTKHSRIDLDLVCSGDLIVDDHHTAEDCAIVLGQLFREALGDRRGIKRFADACVPLDEALARATIDFSGRPSPNISLDLRREFLGAIATENLTHFLQSFALEGRFALHVDVLKGDNDHHKVEAAFKAVARALRAAIERDVHADVPSTKGVLA